MISLYTTVADLAKITSAKAWHVAALNPTDGMPITPNSQSRTALYLGVPWAAAREAQVRLQATGASDRRSLELGTTQANARAASRATRA